MERSPPLHALDMLQSEHLEVTKIQLKLSPQLHFSPQLLEASSEISKRAESSPIREDPSPVTALYIGTDIQLLSIGNNVGVLKIPTFSPLSLDEFKHDIAWSLLIAQDYNMSNLILDLRDNGGGNSSLCSWD